MFTHGHGTVADDPPYLGTLGNLFQQLDGRLCIAKRFISGIHGHGNRHPRVHGIHSDVIA